MPQKPGIYFLNVLTELRSGLPFEPRLDKLTGQVTFPSFHTAAEGLVAALRKGPLVIPAGLYAAVMIAATPIYGGHYSVDLVAGSATAVGAAAIRARQSRSRSLFDMPLPEINSPLRSPGASHP